MSHAVAGTPPARTRTTWLIPLAVLVIGTVVAWWASRPYLVGVFHDDGVYALLAKSLAEGHGFHYLELPGAPAATHYPPLYPLLLAAVWRIDPVFPDNIPLLLGVNAVCVGVAALGLHHLVRRWFGWRQEVAAVVALCAMLGTPVLMLSSALLSEPLFLAGLPVALLLAQDALERESARTALLAGVAIGALMLVRAHAVALLGAVVLLLVVQRRWRQAAMIGVAAVAVQLPWMLWCAQATPRVASPLAGAYGAYSDFLREGLHVVGWRLVSSTARINLHELWLLLGDRVWGGLGPIAGWSAALLLVALLASGAARTARQIPLVPLFIVLYFGIILVWSYAPFRYAWGLWPLLVVLASAGAEWIVRQPRTPRPRLALAVVVALPFAAMLRTEARAYAARSWEQPPRQAARAIAPLVEWIRRNTPPSAAVLVEAPEIVTLFTGRTGAPPVPFTAREYVLPVTAADHERGLAEMIAAVPVRYIVTLNPAVRAAARTLPGVVAIDSLPGAAMFEVGQ